MRRTFSAGVACVLGLLVAAAGEGAIAQDLPGLGAAQAQADTEPPAGNVPLVSPDAEIARRLRDTYAQLDEFTGVRVAVRSGVVTLSGSTLSVTDKQKAQEIAERLDGVVSVENELAAEHRVTRRIFPLLAETERLGRAALAFVPLLAVAILIFVGFWWLGGFLTRSTRLFKKIAPNPFIESLVEQLVRLGFILLGLVAAMSILGATALLGSVLGAAGLFGLAIGFAVRDTIENFIASVLLSVRQPFAPNDHVIIEGYEGKITLLNSRATVITTFDGNEVRIPNATVYKANITNFSRIPERRFDFEIGVGYENDAACALAIALRTVKGVEGVLSEPGPFVIIDRLEAFAVVIKAFGWADQVKSDYGRVKSEAIRQVKDAFDRSGVRLAEPVQNIRALPPTEPQAEEGEPKPKPAAERPDAGEMGAISDTRPVSTIHEKVEAIRAKKDDLLAADGPRE